MNEAASKREVEAQQQKDHDSVLLEKEQSYKKSMEGCKLQLDAQIFELKSKLES
jgi:hypothetical protein